MSRISREVPKVEEFPDFIAGGSPLYMDLRKGQHNLKTVSFFPAFWRTRKTPKISCRQSVNSYELNMSFLFGFNLRFTINIIISFMAQIYVSSTQSTTTAFIHLARSWIWCDSTNKFQEKWHKLSCLRRWIRQHYYLESDYIQNCDTSWPIFH